MPPDSAQPDTPSSGNSTRVDSTMSNDKSNNKPTDPIPYFQFIAEKIKTSYMDPTNKRKISKIIESLKPLFVDCIEQIEKLMEKNKSLSQSLKQTYYTENFEFLKKVNIINKNTNTRTTQYGIDYTTFMKIKLSLESAASEIFRLFTLIYCLFTDIYTIRRIVDKPYCTNAIVYVGDLHCWNILYLLTKHFDFKITHASYSAKSLPELNSEITKQEVTNNTWYRTNLNPPLFYQCSSMEGFPNMFQ